MTGSLRPSISCPLMLAAMTCVPTSVIDEFLLLLVRSLTGNKVDAL